jgi:hypothetical protein
MFQVGATGIKTENYIEHHFVEVDSRAVVKQFRFVWNPSSITVVARVHSSTLSLFRWIHFTLVLSLLPSVGLLGGLLQVSWLIFFVCISHLSHILPDMITPVIFSEEYILQSFPLCNFLYLVDFVKSRLSHFFSNTVHSVFRGYAVQPTRRCQPPALMS